MLIVAAIVSLLLGMVLMVAAQQAKMFYSGFTSMVLSLMLPIIHFM